MRHPTLMIWGKTGTHWFSLMLHEHPDITNKVEKYVKSIQTNKSKKFISSIFVLICYRYGLCNKTKRHKIHIQNSKSENGLNSKLQITECTYNDTSTMYSIYTTVAFAEIIKIKSRYYDSIFHLVLLFYNRRFRHTFSLWGYILQQGKQTQSSCRIL